MNLRSLSVNVSIDNNSNKFKQLDKDKIEVKLIFLEYNFYLNLNRQTFIDFFFLKSQNDLDFSFAQLMQLRDRKLDIDDIITRVKLSLVSDVSV